MDFKKSVRTSKSHKKLKKYSNILKTQYEITTTKDPQRNIVWCNGGLASGISKEDIVEFFGKFGILENILMISKRAYTFIIFKNLASAILCFKSVQGQCHFPQLNGSICLMYVDKVPEIVPNYTKLPPESVLYKDFISPEEEASLLRFVNVEGDGWQSLKQRKVKHFGYEFVYGENGVKKDENLEDIPPLCDKFWDRLKETFGCSLACIPDQLTVNCYEPGHCIPSHIDTHSAFENEILIISLGSDIQMEFKNGQIHSFVHIPRRSLLLLSGESRYAWTHGISSRDRDVYFDEDLGYIVTYRGIRTSFTFRRTRNKPCDCQFPIFCDSKITDNNVLQDGKAAKLENQYVNETYLNIADHFSLTRHKPWPMALEFVQKFEKGSLILDVGCGNGKYFGYNKNIYEIGSELCESLAEICYRRGFDTVNNNCLSLPFKDHAFDGVLCIAVLHHLCTLKRRIYALKELIRVLKPEGNGLVYVWAEQQNEGDGDGDQQEFDCQSDGLTIGGNKVLNDNVTLPVIANNGKNFRKKDILVPWKTTDGDNKVKTYLRYYHIFEEKELRELCESAGGKVINTYYDTGNWCIRFTKME